MDVYDFLPIMGSLIVSLCIAVSLVIGSCLLVLVVVRLTMDSYYMSENIIALTYSSI